MDKNMHYAYTIMIQETRVSFQNNEKEIFYLISTSRFTTGSSKPRDIKIHMQGFV
jgi:hypothetical protein